MVREDHYQKGMLVKLKEDQQSVPSRKWGTVITADSGGIYVAFADGYQGIVHAHDLEAITTFTSLTPEERKAFIVKIADVLYRHPRSYDVFLYMVNKFEDDTQ